VQRYGKGISKAKAQGELRLRRKSFYGRMTDNKRKQENQGGVGLKVDGRGRVQGSHYLDAGATFVVNTHAQSQHLEPV